MNNIHHKQALENNKFNKIQIIAINKVYLEEIHKIIQVFNNNKLRSIIQKKSAAGLQKQNLLQIKFKILKKMKNRKKLLKNKK